jgi:energy-coupling factor transporter ATP-binding protein EcfA2
MAPALAVLGPGKRHGRVQALGGVDLEVREGELVGLLGPNGAGKSTLVKIACSVVRPTRGRAEICGVPAGSPAARACRLPRGALPLPGLARRRRGARAPPPPRGLGRRCSRASRAARARRARRRAASPCRADVEGHAVAPRARPGPRRAPARAAPRLADERARPRPAAHRARAARGAAAARDRRTQLAPPQRGRARVRPRSHHLEGHGRRGRLAGRAAAARRGDRHERRYARLPGRRPRGRAAPGSVPTRRSRRPPD